MDLFTFLENTLGRKKRQAFTLGRKKRQAFFENKNNNKKGGFYGSSDYHTMCACGCSIPVRHRTDSAGCHGMIQQERQNNIINILGGHSYAM